MIDHPDIQYFGFLPTKETMEKIEKTKLPINFASLESIVADIPLLMKNYQLISRINRLNISNMDFEKLEGVFLIRASLIISALSHAYFYKIGEKNKLPDNILIPWKIISEKLNRKSPIRSSDDDFLFNWRIIDDTKEMSFENITSLFPYFVESENDLMVRSIVIMEYKFSFVLQNYMFRTKEALESKNHSLLEDIFKEVALAWKAISKEFLKVRPLVSKSRLIRSAYLDPALWGYTFAKIGMEAIDEELGSSGVESPMFLAMESFLGRTEFRSELGRQMQIRKRKFSFKQNNIITQLEKYPVFDYVQQSGDGELIRAYQKMLKSYLDFFVIHRKRAYSYVKIATLTGRTATNNDQLISPDHKKSQCPFKPTEVLNISNNSMKTLYGELFRKWSDIGDMFLEAKMERKHLLIYPHSYYNIQKFFIRLYHSMVLFLIYCLAHSFKKNFDFSDVCMHNTEDSCYIIINGGVYDFSKFLSEHPGGKKILMASAGLDGSQDFYQVHANNQSLLKKVPIVGVLSLWSRISFNVTINPMLQIILEITALQNKLFFSLEFEGGIVSFNILEKQFISLLILHPKDLINKIKKIFFDTSRRNESFEKLLSFENLRLEKFVNNIIFELRQFSSINEINAFEEAKRTIFDLIKLDLFDFLKSLKNYFYKTLKNSQLLDEDVIFRLASEYEKSFQLCKINNPNFCSFKSLSLTKSNLTRSASFQYYKLFAYEFLEKRNMIGRVINSPRIHRDKRSFFRMFSLNLASSLKTVLLSTLEGDTALITLRGDQRIDFDHMVNLTHKNNWSIAHKQYILNKTRMLPECLTPLLSEEIRAGINFIFLDKTVMNLGAITIGSGEPDVSIELEAKDLVEVWEEFGQIVSLYDAPVIPLGNSLMLS